MSPTQTATVEMTVAEVTALMDTVLLAGREAQRADDVDYSIPAAAAGKCLAATSDILGLLCEYDAGERIQVVYAEHPDLLALDVEGDDEVFYNHYALILPDEDRTVVDFTMRQFYPKSTFPYIAPLDVWTMDLAQVWDAYPVTSVGDDICYDCTVGIDTYCECL